MSIILRAYTAADVAYSTAYAMQRRAGLGHHAAARVATKVFRVEFAKQLGY